MLQRVAIRPSVLASDGMSSPGASLRDTLRAHVPPPASQVAEFARQGRTQLGEAECVNASLTSGRPPTAKPLPAYMEMLKTPSSLPLALPLTLERRVKRQVLDLELPPRLGAAAFAKPLEELRVRTGAGSSVRRAHGGEEGRERKDARSLRARRTAPSRLRASASSGRCL